MEVATQDDEFKRKELQAVTSGVKIKTSDKIRAIEEKLRRMVCVFFCFLL